MEQVKNGRSAAPRRGFWSAAGRFFRVFFRGWMSAGRCCGACDLPWNPPDEGGKPGDETHKAKDDSGK
ncbi:MAG: hypothetical protein WC058_06220 [Phycisphaeraceae bacterium]